MENLLFLGVPILKHIRVGVKRKGIKKKSVNVNFNDYMYNEMIIN